MEHESYPGVLPAKFNLRYWIEKNQPLFIKITSTNGNLTTITVDIDGLIVEGLHHHNIFEETIAPGLLSEGKFVTCQSTVTASSPSHADLSLNYYLKCGSSIFDRRSFGFSDDGSKTDFFTGCFYLKCD